MLWQQPRATDRLPGARGSHAFGCHLDVPVLTRRPTDEVGQHGVIVALPPGRLRLLVGCRRRREPAGHVDGGLEDGCGATRESEPEQRGKRSCDTRGLALRHDEPSAVQRVKP